LDCILLVTAFWDDRDWRLNAVNMIPAFPWHSALRGCFQYQSKRFSNLTAAKTRDKDLRGQFGNCRH